jgi:hypothetical protein
MITENRINMSDFAKAVRSLAMPNLSNARLNLQLQDSPAVRKLLPDFECFLKVKDLKIINQRKTDKINTIELAINARSVSEVRWVTNLAHDFFKTSFLGHSKN